LGDPPESLGDVERAAWHELAALAPAGVLTKADRWLIEIACRLMAAGREHGFGGRHGITAGEIGLLNSCLRSMGLTPADRSRVNLTSKPDVAPNPFSQFSH
jgi:hypothetical protein